MAQERAFVLAVGDRDGCGEVAAGAVAADGDAFRIDAEVGGVLGCPPNGGLAVVEALGELVLGRL